MLGTAIVILLTYYHQMFSPEPNSSFFEWSKAVFVSQGVQVYPPEAQFREGITLLYMPIYFLTTGFLMQVFGETAVVCKVVSGISVLVTASLIYQICVLLTKRRVLSILPAVMFMMYPTVQNWVTEQTKVDTMALMFSTAALLLILKKEYLWSVPLLVLSFFTKQDYVALPLATGLYLLVRDKGTLLKFTGLYCVLAIIGFGMGQYFTQGTFITHVIGFLWQPQFGKILLDRTIGGTLVCLGYLTPVLVLAVYSIWRSRYF